MTNRFDTTALLDQIRRIPSVPTSQALFSDADILRLANQQLKLSLVPKIQSVVEEYFVYTADYTVDSSTPYITIPSEASGLRLREIYYLDSDGGKIKHQAVRIQLEQLGTGMGYYAFGVDGDNQGAYYLENDKIRFWPEPTSTKYVRIAYYRIPNELVPVDEGRVVSRCSVVENGFEVTEAPPADWDDNLTQNYLFDVIDPNLPFNTKATITVNGISNDIFYVNDATQLAQVSPGDYIYYRGTAPVIQYVPQECFYYLAQATACKLLEALGDNIGLQAAQLDLDRLSAQMMKIISPRTIGSPKRVVNKNSAFGAARLSWYTVSR